MVASALVPLTVAAFLLVVPPDLVGAAEPWEHGTVRLTGLFLALHGLVTFSAFRAAGRSRVDPAVGRLAGVVGATALAFLLTGNGLFLVLSFSFTVGMTLNRMMKRLDLVFERAQDRVGWRVPFPEQRRRL